MRNKKATILYAEKYRASTFANIPQFTLLFVENQIERIEWKQHGTLEQGGQTMEFMDVRIVLKPTE